MVSSIEIAVKKVLDSLGENYHHQHRIGKFLVDFYLPDRNLVIEADGDYWHSLERNRKNDIKKDQYMKESQINLVRLKESDIRRSCDALVRAALEQFPIIQGET
jgi:very-short-patch-repair endonuclease